MKTTRLSLTGCILAAISLGAPNAFAAKSKASKQPAVQEVALNATGEKLLKRYTDQLKTLQSEITKALPTIDEQKKTALLKAYQSESAATAEEVKAMKATAKSKDKEAAAKVHDAAKQVLAKATADAESPVKAVLPDTEKILASDKLDAQLVKFAVLAQATPRGLAEFCQQGAEHEALVEKLLSDGDLMKQMIVADGIESGKYGQAMKIYTDIQKASSKAKDGNLQRLALAVSLEHAEPIAQSNPESKTDAPATVDPVKRYLHFEKAFLNGELDPAFKDLTVWEYRNAVNGDEPDETLAWGREMLRNYRPDLISTPDTRWRYVESVKTEVKYGSQEVKNDRPDLQRYQNMIMNGGVCGRRAFFGRFILRCFGIPTLARPQPGHATLVHWAPDGWVINLGASWGWGTVGKSSDIDFLAMTQARKNPSEYMKVLRAQWVGMVLGETKAAGFHDSPSGFWNGVALYTQRAINDKSKAVAIAAVGTDIGEANESKEKDVIHAVTMSESDRKIVVDKDGTITIPAVACSTPAASTPKIRFMPSNLGGMQLHYSRTGAAESFEYVFDAPTAGKYQLSARVVTTSANQNLLFTANGAGTPTDIAMPFTLGMWQTSDPVEVSLIKGRNVLRFSRPDGCKGLTIRDFTLKPLR